MKKLLVILLIPIFLFLGCTSSIKDDLINYIDISLPPLTEYEEEAMDIFNEALSKENYTYESLYTILDKEVIPKYENFTNRLDNTSIVTDEVNELHNIYKAAVNTKLDGLIMLKKGLLKKDKEYIDNSNKMLKQSTTYMDEFYNKLDKLIKEYKIK